MLYVGLSSHERVGWPGRIPARLRRKGRSLRHAGPSTRQLGGHHRRQKDAFLLPLLDYRKYLAFLQNSNKESICPMPMR